MTNTIQVNFNTDCADKNEDKNCILSYSMIHFDALLRH